jgi:hypothetical protein
LYELFLAGCYEKAEEIDDSSGNLGMFFKDLFCGWIKARQAAGRDLAETIHDIMAWMDRDDYGFCFDIDGDVALALDREGSRLFTKHLEDRLESALAPYADKEPKAIFDGHFSREDGGAVRTPFMAPIANCFAESWIGSFNREALDHFFCFCLAHLDHIIRAPGFRYGPPKTSNPFDALLWGLSGPSGLLVWKRKGNALGFRVRLPPALLQQQAQRPEAQQ